MFDIIYVTYNSSKWIKKCFSSWKNVKYDLSKVHVYVIDNNSTDDTVVLLEEEKLDCEKMFGSFTIMEERKNWGFGKGNNLAFSKGNSEYVCFLNIDTEMMQDTLLELEKEINNSSTDVVLWEFRQFPYEHPKMYNILTGETTWCSGAAFAIRRKVYQEVGGFDVKIFMYAEDVDLSWRIRTYGYKLCYAPRVKIIHYSYETAGEIKPNQHVYGVINNLLLRYRYGHLGTVVMGHVMFWKHICAPEAFPGAKKLLLKQYWKHFGLVIHFNARGKFKRDMSPVASFIGWDYSTIRDGALYENFLPKTHPLISVVVRTCGRPSVLRETLISLRKQTYDNLEVVIIEDGLPISQEMIEKEFSDLNILYHATENKVGRSKAGNLGMSLAHGKYLNFLDDDDLFFADHIEILVANIEKSGKLAAYATSYETPIEVLSKDPYIYNVKNYLGVHKQPFNRIMLCHHNYIPIQCIMFSRELFEKYGGLDETVDALEDWDMWVRYSLYTDFTFVFKTTSIYRVPALKEVNLKRQKGLDDALVVMREKHKSYMQKMSVYDIAMMYQNGIY